MTIPIVVVDDDEVDRYLVRRVVKSLGIDAKVFEFVDGEDFVELVRDRTRFEAEVGVPPPALLVLLDINMPRMNGFEVLEALETELSGTDQMLFVTMYSSSSHAQDRSDVEKYGFVKEYIVKPVTKETLGALIDVLYPG